MKNSDQAPSTSGWGPELPALPQELTSPQESTPLQEPTPSPEPAAPKSPGIRPDDLLAEAGRKVWRFLLGEMKRNEDGTRQGQDIEALHDMRVATRRMRAAVDVFGPAFKPGALQPHLKGLRQTGRVLGRVRDLDVILEKAHRYLADLPAGERSGLDPLLDYWARQREIARDEMLAHLNSREYADFVKRFSKFLKTPGAGVSRSSERHLPAVDPSAENSAAPPLVKFVAPVLIYTRLAQVRAFEPLLANASIELLHTLRIEFKKLRYSVEYFREVLGEEAGFVISEVKRMQDHLGDLNDADVAAGILAEFLETLDASQARLPIIDRSSSEPILAYLVTRHAERHRLMITFGSAWERFQLPEFRRALALAVSAL